jgi:hypothetical protein
MQVRANVSTTSTSQADTHYSFCETVHSSASLSELYQLRGADIVKLSQQIQRLVPNQTFHCCVRNNQQLTPTLSQKNPVHARISYFWKIHLTPTYTHMFQVYLPFKPNV